MKPYRSGVVCGLATFVVAVLALGVIYWLARDALKESVREQLRILALGAARVVDVNLHEHLQTKEQMGSPEHLQALAPLVEYHKQFPNILYLYTVRVKEGKQSFVLDTWYDPSIAARGKGTLSPIGEDYASDSPTEDAQTLAAIAHGEPHVSSEIFQDEYGEFLSGSAPLHDSTGRIVGYAGVDLTMKNYYAALWPIQQALLAGLLVAAVLSAGVGGGVAYFLKSRQRNRLDAGAQQALLARMLESLTDGILVLRAERHPATREIFDFEVLLANPAAKRLTNLPANAVAGGKLLALMPSLASPKLMDDYLRVARTGQPQQTEWHFTRGAFERWLRLAVTRVDDRLVLVLVDISSTKMHESEVVSARDAAEHADRAKSQFLANLSHEVRTPLNAIMGMTNLFKGTPLTQEQGEYLHAIEESSDALMSVISDVLDFSKIESGHLHIESILFEVRDLLHRLQDIFTPLARNKGLDFVLEIAPTVPRMVLSDPARLRQILMNLLVNAVKFTEHGKVMLRVEVSGDAEWLWFHVADTGIGIAPHLRQTIFAPFTQGDPSTTRRYGGTGLGLAIATQLTTRLGGQIDLESEPGWGSTFTLRLPMRTES